jgi:hypothetical protein
VIASDWNALCQGDAVVVHERADSGARRSRLGFVEFVWVRRPTNEVGIRIATSAGSCLVWPDREDIHARTFAEAAVCRTCGAAVHRTLVDPRLN